MLSNQVLPLLPIIFTFHYGSILIYCVSSYPISVNLFTFHYGSILIVTIGIHDTGNFDIYIPLWFYSNTEILIVISDLTLIYIPLWFYSNPTVLIISVSSFPIFTFHYGSILIKMRGGVFIERRNLHSTMVLF